MRSLCLAVFTAFALVLPSRAETDGRVDPTFAPVIRDRGQVEQVVAAPDGRFLLTGDFTHFEGQPAAGGVWISAAGQFLSEFRRQAPADFKDRPIGVFPDGRVLAVRASQSQVIVERPTDRLIRLLADGALDASFQPLEIPAFLGALILPDGKVLVRGQELRVSGRIGLQRLRNDGTIDPTFVPPTLVADTGRGLARQSDGRILVRASYSTMVGGAPVERLGLSRLHPDGALDLTFQYSGPLPGNSGGFLGGGGSVSFADEISVLSDDRVFIYSSLALLREPGATFPFYRLQANGATDAGFVVNDNTVSSVLSAMPLPDGGALIVNFSPNGLQVIRFLATGALDTAFAGGRGSLDFQNFDTTALLQARPGGNAILAGKFRNVGTTRRASLAGIAANGTIDPAFGAATGIEHSRPTISQAVLATDGKVWINGSFASIGGVPRPGLARLMPDGTLDASFNPPTNLRGTEGLCDDGAGGLYAIVYFVASDGNHLGVAHFLSDGSGDPSFQPPLELSITAPRTDFPYFARLLRQPDGKLLLAAELVDSNPAQGLRLVRLLPTGALEPNFRIVLTSELIALAPNGRIHAGNKAYLPDGTADASFAPAATFPEYISALLPDAQGRLLVADQYSNLTEPGQVTAHRNYGGLRRFLANGSVDSTFQPPLRPYGPFHFRAFETLAEQPDGRILAGGAFISYAGRDRNSVLRLTPNGGLDTSFDAGAGVFAESPALHHDPNRVKGLVVQPNGDVLVFGSFTSFDGQPRSGLARVKSAPQPAAPASGAGRLINVSTRAYVGTGDQVMIGGFVLRGPGTRRIILRGLGPSLTAFGVQNALLNPTIRLVNAAGTTLASNDDWASGGAPAGLAEAQLELTDPRESALVVQLGSGAYTLVVSGVNGTSGIALVEVYDLDPPSDTRIVNLATRAMTDRPRGDGTYEPTIAGFAIRGGKLRATMRGLAPSLAAFGVVDPLAYPDLTLRLANGDMMYAMSGFQNQPPGHYTVGNLTTLGLKPTRNEETALILDLPEGNYTAEMGSTYHQGTPRSGVAIVEVYDVEENVLGTPQP